MAEAENRIALDRDARGAPLQLHEAQGIWAAKGGPRTRRRVRPWKDTHSQIREVLRNAEARKSHANLPPSQELMTREMMGGGGSELSEVENTFVTEEMEAFN
eukprot:7071612-Pyramimonas_sp.AAC.1